TPRSWFLADASCQTGEKTIASARKRQHANARPSPPDSSVEHLRDPAGARLPALLRLPVAAAPADRTDPGNQPHLRGEAGRAHRGLPAQLPAPPGLQRQPDPPAPGRPGPYRGRTRTAAPATGDLQCRLSGRRPGSPAGLLATQPATGGRPPQRRLGRNPVAPRA